MTKKNLLEVEKQRLWSKLERRHGLTFPQALRDKLEMDSGVDAVGSCDRGEVTRFLSDLSGVVEELLERARYLQDDRYLKGLFNSRTETKPAGTRRKYARPFEKRLHLVDFVVGRRLTGGQLARRSVRLHERYNWKTICAEWNGAYPHDPMTPAVLKSTFYRAVRDHDLQGEFLARRERHYQARFREALSRFPTYDGRWDSWSFEHDLLIDETGGIPVSGTWFPVPLSPTSACLVNLEGEVMGPITVSPRSGPRTVIDKEGKVTHEE